MNKHNYTSYTYYPLIVGIVVGTFLYLLLQNKLTNEAFIINSNKIVDLYGSNDNIILFIVRQRVSALFLFLFFMFFFSFKTVSSIFCFISGIFYGVMTTYLFIQFYFEEIFISIGMFFPHYFLYFSALCLYGRFFDDNRYSFRFNKFNNLNFFVKIAIIIFFMLAGLSWEIFFQKNFIKILPTSSV